MHAYIGLSVATGLPWEYFLRQDERDADVVDTYYEILKSTAPKSKRGE